MYFQVKKTKNLSRRILSIQQFPSLSWAAGGEAAIEKSSCLSLNLSK